MFGVCVCSQEGAIKPMSVIHMRAVNPLLEKGRINGTICMKMALRAAHEPPWRGAGVLLVLSVPSITRLLRGYFYNHFLALLQWKWRLFLKRSLSTSRTWSWFCSLLLLIIICTMAIEGELWLNIHAPCFSHDAWGLRSPPMLFYFTFCQPMYFFFFFQQDQTK